MKLAYIREIQKRMLINLAYYYLVRKYYFLSEKNVMKKQSKALKRKLRSAVKHCKYYFSVIENSAVKEISIEHFPIIDKEIITNNFEDFISDNIEMYYSYDRYTGGSTGEPFHFIGNGGYEYGFDLKRWKIYGYKKGDRILALDGTKVSEEKIEKGIYWEKVCDDDIPFGSYALSSLYLRDDNAKKYCEYIIDFKPAFFWGYPSFIYLLACYAEKLEIDMNINIKGIVLTSETAYSYQIEKIKKIFNTSVYLQYGHTESCVNAYTYDETYRYRVEPLYGYVEVLDASGNPVTEGEVGEVVVTSLHNYAMPLVRYRTGDLAEYGGKDERYIYLNKVMGRTQDIIYDNEGNKILLTALIFGQHFVAMGHIQKWQVEQWEKGKVILHIVKGDGYSEKHEKELESLFYSLGHVLVTFDYIDDIMLTKRGKTKFLVQHIKE